MIRNIFGIVVTVSLHVFLFSADNVWWPLPVWLAVYHGRRRHLHHYRCDKGRRNPERICQASCFPSSHELWVSSAQRRYAIPADTWRNNKVIITPKRRCDVVFTLQWRCYYVLCPLGWGCIPHYWPRNMHMKEPSIQRDYSWAWGGDLHQPEQRPLVQTKYDAFVSSAFCRKYFSTNWIQFLPYISFQRLVHILLLWIKWSDIWLYFRDNFSVKTKVNTSNLAYTPQTLGLHTDLPYYHYCPGVSDPGCILHVLFYKSFPLEKMTVVHMHFREWGWWWWWWWWVGVVGG